MKNKIILRVPAVAMIVLILMNTSCNNDDDDVIAFDHAAQLSNIMDNGIIPRHELFWEATSKLKEDALLFSLNSTLPNWINLQDSWKSTATIWRGCELYNIGPVKDAFSHIGLNTWPVNNQNIEQYIENATTIDVTYIHNVGASSKGIMAMEYFLFNEEANTTIDSLTENEKRMDYLVALTQNLEVQALNINTTWSAYAPIFKSAVENNLDGGQNLSVNAMVSLLENIHINKLGKALENGNGGTVSEEKLEGYRSRMSLQFLKENTAALNRLFYGDFDVNNNKIGFDDNLTQLGNTALLTEFDTAFSRIDNAIAAIDSSLEETLQTNPEKLITLQNTYQELIILLKVDLASYLNFTITFNDTDGD